MLNFRRMQMSHIFFHLRIRIELKKGKIIAIILAGGDGTRFNINQTENLIPKQFIKIDGKTVLETTVDAFEKNDSISEIVVVTNEKYVELTISLLSQKNYSKVASIVKGGKTRFLSSYYGQKQVFEMLKTKNQMLDNVYILIHDAARSFVSQIVIDNVISRLDTADGVQPIVPVTDTLVQKISGKWITQNRDDYAFVQTPQGFNFNKIYHAYQSAINSPESSWIPTDDISVLQEYSHNAKIVSVSGDYKNRKITYFEDLKI